MKTALGRWGKVGLPRIWYQHGPHSNTVLQKVKNKVFEASIQKTFQEKIEWLLITLFLLFYFVILKILVPVYFHFFLIKYFVTKQLRKGRVYLIYNCSLFLWRHQGRNLKCSWHPVKNRYIVNAQNLVGYLASLLLRSSRPQTRQSRCLNEWSGSSCISSYQNNPKIHPKISQPNLDNTSIDFPGGSGLCQVDA